jgi:ABC-2 type transport system ATP-binding protein
VHKRFGRREKWVLAGIDLELEAGTITEVAGGNGSGKSTLLRVVAGLTQPTSGVVRSRPPAVAYAPERLPARLRMPARAYAGHMAALRRLDPAPYITLLERFALAPSADVAIGTLSKGNRQKVALAQALAPPAGLVLLDEPSSGLDASAREVLREVLDERRAAGAAVLLATHHPVEGLAADHTFELEAGVLRPRSPARPMMRIELCRGEDTCVLDVSREESDGALAEALAHGWSVVSVRPR